MLYIMRTHIEDSQGYTERLPKNNKKKKKSKFCWVKEHQNVDVGLIILLLVVMSENS